jgi:hypothetical protein
MDASASNGRLRPARAADDVRSRMWDMITAYRVSQIVRCAAAFSLAEHCLADGVITAASIARFEQINPDAAGRLLRACLALDLLTCEDGTHFKATPLLNILRRDIEGSQWGFAMSLPAPGHWGLWGKLPEAVRTGKAQGAEFGGTIFDYYDTHREEASAFMEGLEGMTAVAGAEAARLIDTNGIEKSIDVGGATGTLTHALMKANTKLHGIVYDVPVVAEQAIQAARALGLADRLTAVGGDFFQSVPPGGDIYLLRYVLHDWDDAECIQILQNCRNVMAPNTKLYVLEMVLSAVGADDPVVPMQDLNMLAVLHGRERSLAEFDRLFDRAGLKRTAARATNSPMWVIEAMASPM